MEQAVRDDNGARRYELLVSCGGHGNSGDTLLISARTGYRVPDPRRSVSPPIAPPAGLAREASPGGNVPRLAAHHSFGAAQGNLPAGTRKALNALVPAEELAPSAVLRALSEVERAEPGLSPFLCGSWIDGL